MYKCLRISTIIEPELIMNGRRQSKIIYRDLVDDSQFTFYGDCRDILKLRK